MTFESLKVPGLSEFEQSTLNRLLKEIADRTPRNLLRGSYYDGKRAVRQVGTIIPPQYYRLALALGWSAKAVDSLSRRCNLDSLIWADGDLDSLGYRKMWDGNRLRTEISSGITSSLIHGVSFVVNTQGDESLGEPVGLIHVKDALSASGTWNPRTRGLDSLVSITGRDDDGKVNSFALYLRNLTIVASKDKLTWTVDRSTHTFGVPAEPLVYKPRVGKPFGYSRISPVTMSMHDAGLRTLVRTEGHADVFSFPEMWMLGADESIFKNSDGSPKASWQVMLGRIKGIPDDEEAANPRADVKQFSASSPQPHIDLFTQQAKTFAGEHDIPVSALGVQAESNSNTEDGSTNADQSMIAEAEGATDDWTAPILRAASRALAMQNDLEAVPEEWLSIDAKWRPAAHLSRAAQADAGAKIVGAVPALADTEVGLELLGLSEQQVRRAMSEKRRLGGSTALAGILERASAQVTGGDAERTP